MGKKRSTGKQGKAGAQYFGKRDILVLQGFIDALAAGLPLFKEAPAEVQRGFAEMAWVTGTKSRAHKKWNGYASFPYQHLDDRFGRGQFMKINARLGIFITTPWSKEENLTRGFQLTPAVARILQDYLRESLHKPTTLVDGAGRKVSKLPKAIAGKDMNAHTAGVFGGLKLRNQIPIDVRALETMHANLLDKLEGQQLTGNERARTEHCCYSVAKLLCHSQAAPTTPGHLAVHYVEAESGRLYALRVSLQNAPREVKHAALHDRWEYDIDNAHFAIFVQMAARCGVACPSIDQYLADKHAVRKRVANDLGLSGEEVKHCLLFIMYGARASEWSDSAIPKAIGQKAAALYKHPLFAGVLKDIKRGRAAILKTARPVRRRLRNEAGKTASAQLNGRQRLAHLIQGVEALMLRVAVTMYPDDLILLQHDGFTSLRRVDVSGLESAILEQTGYRVRISEKQLCLPAEALEQEPQYCARISAEQLRVPADTPERQPEIA